MTSQATLVSEAHRETLARLANFHNTSLSDTLRILQENCISRIFFKLILVSDATAQSKVFSEKVKATETKAAQELTVEDERLLKEYQELQKNVENEKQKIHKRVTDQVKLIYQ